MGEVKLNIYDLDGKIQKLRDLKAECEEVDVMIKPLSGSGEIIDMIALIDKEYPMIKATILAIISNSISFFENVKTSMVSADKSASTNISVGGN